MSPESVSACIASLCSAYHDGNELIQQIRGNRKASKTFRNASVDISIQELELSLRRGESAVRNQYELIYKRYGDAFAQGDQLARDALQDNVTCLHGQVIANIRAQWEQDTFVDYIALQDKCDSIQDRAMLILMQLQQRTITMGPATLPVDPLSAVGPFCSSRRNSDQAARQNISTVVVPSSSDTFSASGTFPHVQRSLSPVLGPLTPPGTPNPSKYFLRPDSARGSRERTSIDRRDAAQYKPMATTVTTAGFLGIGKRTKVEPAVSPPENPLVDEYLAVAIEDANNRLVDEASMGSKTDSISISIPVGSTSDINQPAFNPWPEYHSSSAAVSQAPIDSIIPSNTVYQDPLHKFSGSISSFGSQRPTSAAAVEILSSNRSNNPVDPKDLLPNEINKYAGFCKGAWRQQVGDRKRAIEERVRPGGMYNAAKYYQCKHCKFEGRLIPMDKKNNGFDVRVFKLVQGIQFRWEFMFKSHFPVKEACSDPTKATFGCIFCCAQGRGTPMFDGIQAFMNHLVEHRGHLPTGEVLYRTNCLIGRPAAISEDFDINIISLEGGKI